MSKIKVSTLTEPLLDYWAAKANGEAPYIKQYFDGTKQCWIESSDSPYSPSTNWAQCGPLIESEKIKVADSGYTLSHVAWRAGIGWGKNEVRAYGDTPLIAAMRCFVSSKFGEEVDEA